MSVKRNVATVLCVLLASTLVFAGCTAKKESAAESIKVGALYPLSGAMASDGANAKAALELTVDIINNKHDIDLPFAKTEGIPSLGGRKIEVVFADTQGSPEIGMAETERLITQEKVVAIIGAYQSSVTKVSSQVAERLETPWVCPDAISPELARRGLKWYFMTVPDGITEGEQTVGFLDWAAQTTNMNLKSMKVGLIYEDTDFGRDTLLSRDEQLRQAGYNVVEKIHYPHETSDLSAEVMKLKSAGIEILMQGGYTADTILFVKTMKELDYNPYIIMAQPGGATNPDFTGTLGDDADYWVTSDYFSLGAAGKKPVLRVVNDMYKAKRGLDLDAVSSSDVTALLVLADALERAGSTEKDKLRDALAATDMSADEIVNTYAGIDFDERGYNIESNVVFHQIRDGKYKLIWPTDLAEVELVFPAPKWGDR